MLRIVEPAAARDRERVRHVERVERIEPGVLVGGAKRDRADRNRIAGWPEEYAAAADDVVWTDRAQFGAGPEAGDAGVETGADHEVVVVPEQLVGVGCLQGRPGRRRTGRRPVDLPEHRVGGEGIGKLDAVEAVCRRGVVVEAKQRRIGGAWLRSSVGLPSTVFCWNARTRTEPSIVQVGVASTFPVRLR